MACGRGPDDARPEGVEACRAATERLLDGMNGGRNGGRSCWAVVGSFAMDRHECGNADELACIYCDFFRSVVRDELPHLELSPAILERLGYANVLGPRSEGWLDDELTPANACPGDGN
jgi:hypothetical protein